MVEKVPTGVAAHALCVPLLVQHSQEEPGGDDFFSNVFTHKLFFTISVIVKCQEEHERQERSDRRVPQKC